MNNQVRYCKYCGEPIKSLAYAGKRFCSEECYKASYHKNASEIAREEKAKKKERRKNQKEIARIAKEANEKNTSYGKLMVKTYAPHFDRERREWV